MTSIDQLKQAPRRYGTLRYKLKNANVYVSRDGFHYTDYLDPVDALSPEIDGAALTPEEISYIENVLQWSSHRFRHQLRVTERYADLAQCRVLDIGCGGGMFLSMVRSKGADVVGIELSDSRASYAKAKYNIPVYKCPIEDPYWKASYCGYFDVVTLWDVVEHVNYPLATLEAATAVLKDGGLLMIDTPCRESAYHQIGRLTYNVSRGRYPTFLNSMYSSHMFGHKQIFLRREIERMCRCFGLEVVESTRFGELSFPCEFYLRRLTGSDACARILAGPVGLLVSVFKVRNKMLVVARKPGCRRTSRC